MPEKHLTIEDIARLAGVSKATVSRVLNRKPDVDPATRERVLHLMHQYGFVPNATATNLAGGRSHLIGMVVRSYTWLFVPEIMRAVADVIDQTPYELVLYRMNDQLPDDDGIPPISRLLATNLTSGVLAVFPGQASAQLANLAQKAVPMVVIDDQYLPVQLSWGEFPIPWIGGENKIGAYEAVRHLIEHGHRRIAHIQGPMDRICARERHEGYCQALEEAGLGVDPALLQEGDFNAPSGQTSAEKLFTLPKEQRPTAIFASSDLMAYGVLAAAQEHGVSIPDDVALVGFDDLANLAESIVIVGPGHTPLTTVRQPFYEMGRYAMQVLLSLIETSYIPGYQHRGWPFVSEPGSLLREATQSSGAISRIKLPVELIVRASCGCTPSATDF
jgi:LacI family transcriptional regulator